MKYYCANWHSKMVMIRKYGKINDWNVSKEVTDMSGMFKDAESFNEPLNNWNVSNDVIDMEGMFYNTSFNQPLNNWNVL